jgi:hypothetical protein
MLILGVDIGSAGALALVDEAGELLDVADMPILRDGPAKRPAVNGPLLAALVGRWRPDRAIIEYVGARGRGICLRALAWRLRGHPGGFGGSGRRPRGNVLYALLRGGMERRMRRGLRRSGDGPPRPRYSLGSKMMAGPRRRSLRLRA